MIVELPDDLMRAAMIHPASEHRSLAQQIEYWARLGKVAEENSDVPIQVLQDTLASLDDIKVGNLSPYQFG